MKANRTLIKLAIICIAMQDAGFGATTPALANIMAAFPAINPSIIMMVATVPTIVLAFMPPLYAKLCEVTSKRSLLYVAAVFFLIGGVGPAFFHSDIYIILVFRFILGVGNGIVLPMSCDLVVDFFEGQERNTMQGYVSAVTSFSGILFSLLGGYLAGIRWDFCFYSYFVAVVFFLVPFFLLPEPDRKAKMAAGSSTAPAKLPANAYVVAMIFGFFFFFLYSTFTNTAVILLGEKLAEPGAIGLSMALLTSGSFVASACFGQLFNVLKFNLLPLTYLVSAVGFYICYISSSFEVYSIGLVLIGMSMGTNVPVTVTKVTGLVPYASGTRVIGLVFFAQGFFAFAQPIVYGIVMNALHQAPGRFPLLISIMGMLVFTIIAHFVNKATPTLQDIYPRPANTSA